jgi:hypothetical protein
VSVVGTADEELPLALVLPLELLLQPVTAMAAAAQAAAAAIILCRTLVSSLHGFDSAYRRN